MKIFNIVITTSTLSFLFALLQGCSWAISPLGSSPDYLLSKNGGLVRDCNGRTLFKNSPNTIRFWTYNNLPKGTTDFVCKNGKAYLPNQVPNN